jgi:hypothetical protein
MIQVQPQWNSIEVTKLLVEALTPIGLVFLGIWVNRIAKRVEAAQWANQKLIEKRIAVYDKLAPLVNDLYCYFMCVGNWKDLTPKQMVEAKRALDKKVYIYESLFSHEFKDLYNKFIHLCFMTYTGQGHDAKLRTLLDHPKGGDRTKSSSTAWQAEWNTFFSAKEDSSSPEDVDTAYKTLMSRFSEELGVGLERGE